MRGKRVMIGKRVLNDIETPSAQVAKETSGVADTGNGMDGSAPKGFERPRRLPPLLGATPMLGATPIEPDGVTG